MRVAITAALATLLACSHPHPHPEGLPSAKGPATPVEPQPDAAMATPVEAPPVDASAPAPAPAPAPVSGAPAPTANPCGGGISSVATVEHGTMGHGSGYGVGGGGCGHGGRTTAVPKLTVGTPAVGAGLDKTIVRRYLRQHSAQFLYCYEKQLLANPQIEGAMALSFTIAADGTLTGVTATGVDPAVSSCVRDTWAPVELPKPKGGAPVTANVTLTFKPK